MKSLPAVRYWSPPTWCASCTIFLYLVVLLHIMVWFTDFLLRSLLTMVWDRGVVYPSSPAVECSHPARVRSTNNVGSDRRRRHVYVRPTTYGPSTCSSTDIVYLGKKTDRPHFSTRNIPLPNYRQRLRRESGKNVVDKSKFLECIF